MFTVFGLAVLLLCIFAVANLRRTAPAALWQCARERAAAARASACTHEVARVRSAQGSRCRRVMLAFKQNDVSRELRYRRLAYLAFATLWDHAIKVRSSAVARTGGLIARSATTPERDRQQPT